MNNLQTRKAQIEKEIAETREYINSLGNTPQDDIRWEREMRYCSRLRTELLEINNKIAKAELDAYHPTIATTEEPAPEEADSYLKLLPELKQACSSDKVNISDLTSYAMRIDTLEQAGELTDKQRNELNRYKEELRIKWNADK